MSRSTAHAIAITVAIVAALALVATFVLVSVPAVAVSPTSQPSANGSATNARLVSVYPNPIADGDRGEFVHLSPGTCTNLTLTDGETSVALSGSAGATSSIVVTNDPRGPAVDIVRAQYPNLTVIDTPIGLANGGERLRLYCGETLVDATRYESAPESEQWHPSASSGRDEGVWRSPGYTPRQARTYGATNATAFVLPDNPAVPIRTLERADRRILLAGYTFTSARATRALVAAVERGVRVRVLVEGGPVGGLSANQAALLDRLTSTGVEVVVLSGPRARFAFHHAKYAIVDDAALVLTENWKPAGTGGRSSRGWGVRLESPQVAADLAELFAADARAHDAVAWSEFRRGRTFPSQPSANGSYPRRFAPESMPIERVRVLTAPGNAEQAVVGLIDSAEERVSVIQPTIGSRDGPFLSACLRAAKRGVEVRILLSGAWYAVEDNRRLVDELNAYADRQGLPISARIAEPRSRYEKIHAKGLLVDGKTVVVGSLNWNRHSARENREVAVALRGQAIAEYFQRVFDADWQGGSQRIPVVLVAVALGTVAVALGVARRTVPFEVGGLDVATGGTCYGVRENEERPKT